MIPIKQISVTDLKAKLDRHEHLRLIDVREANEYALCKIEGSFLIPLSTFTNNALKELKPDEEIIIHCHHGGRSQKACEYLAANGFKNVANVSGGIHAWSVEVDSNVAQY